MGIRRLLGILADENVVRLICTRHVELLLKFCASYMDAEGQQKGEVRLEDVKATELGTYRPGTSPKPIQDDALPDDADTFGEGPSRKRSREASPEQDALSTPLTRSAASLLWQGVFG